MKRLLIGLDIGTSGTKTILMDETGVVVRAKTIEYDTIVQKPGWSEMRVQTWWEAVVQSLRLVLDGVEPSALAALSFSGQMHGMVALDQDNQVVRPAILWNDVRTQAQCDQITQAAGGLEALLGYTNNRMLPGYTGGKILWMKQNEPENYAKTKRVVNPKDYIRFLLTGVLGTEVSDASGTGFFDVKHRRFCSELIEKAGLCPDLFAPCTESDAVTGAVTAWASAQTGLPEGLPVVAGGGDAVLQTTCTGLVSSDVLGVVIGTSGVVATGISGCPENQNGDLQLFCNNAPGLWHAMGITLAAGGSFKWFRDTLCQAEKAQAQREGISVYDLLNAQAQSAPVGSDGVIFLPYLSGERCPHSDPNARGTFVGLSLKTNHAAMTRAVMEGITYSLKSVGELMGGVGAAPKKIIASGGGASSAVWRQILADVFGVPVYTLSGAGEGGAYGAAMLAGIGVGVYRDWADACAILKEETCTMPSGENTAKYARIFQIYQSLYGALKPSFDAMALLP